MLACHTVRPARLADALALAQVQHAAVHGLAAEHYPQSVLELWAPAVTLVRAERLYRETQDAGGRHYVAELRGEVIGFGVVLPEAGEIQACYVAPIAVRCGVGRTLLIAMEAAVEAAGVHEIGARASVNAKSFYRAQGYASTGRGEHQFEDGTRMVVVQMRKDISPLF